MIQRVEALNYRSLRYISQRLRPFQVLVGPNAAGKSTFLDVIALLSDYVQKGLDQALLFGFEPGQGRARSLDELIFKQSSDRFELALELAIPDILRQERQDDSTKSHPDLARYEVAFGKRAKGQLEVLAETLWLIDNQASQHSTSALAQDPSSQLFPVEPTPPPTLITSDQSPAGWQAVVRKIPGSIDISSFQAEGGDWYVEYRSGPRKAALASLPEDPERFPISIWVRNLLLDGIRVLALNSAVMRRPVSPSVARKFSVEGANLPLVIQDLTRDHPLAYQDWMAHVQTILPDIKQIHVKERPEDRHLYLAISYENMIEPVPAWLVSDGTLRLLALTLLAYLPDETGIYLIEEPENGIHPKAIEGVFQSLSSVYQGQVLVATHSPLFLGLAEPALLLCFAKNLSGAVDIVRGDQHPALKNWCGQVDLSTLYVAGVLG